MDKPSSTTRKYQLGFSSLIDISDQTPAAPKSRLSAAATANPVLLSSSPADTRKTTPPSTSVSGVATRIILCLVLLSGLVALAPPRTPGLPTSQIPMSPPNRVLLPIRTLRAPVPAMTTVAGTLVTSRTKLGVARLCQ
jgi:hypothetical protein